MQSSRKGRTGLRRAWNATRYSIAGLAAAARHEAAFREIVLMIAVLAPLGLWLGESGVERALLLGSLFLPLIAEILNAAIEAVTDRVSLDDHPLAKRAKDMGSAAVMLALAGTGVIWLLVLV